MKLKQTLLIVDDENDIREIFSLIYAEDFNIFTASSGNEAFKVYQDNDIDIVLTDLKMPDGDGAHLAQSITDYKEKTPCPIFLMTAHLEYDYDDLMSRGIKVIFSKPFDFDQFLKVATFYLTAAKKDDYTRIHHRVECNFITRFTLSSVTDTGTILDFSPTGFLIKLPVNTTLEIGDKILFATTSHQQDDNASSIEGSALCRWWVQHEDHVLAGFQITPNDKQNKIIKCYNDYQINKGSFN